MNSFLCIVSVSVLLSACLPTISTGTKRPVVFGGTTAIADVAQYVTQVWSYFNGVTDEPGSYCTGSVFKRDKILTAAHCVVDIDGKFADYVEIYIGLVTANPKGTDAYVASEIHVLRNYVIEEVETFFDDDIAVITLRSSLPATQRLVKLAKPKMKKRLEAEQTLTAVGFGAIDSNDTAPATIQQANVTFRDFDECVRRNIEYNGYGTPQDYNNKTQLCTSGPDWGPEGICAGDSGGPLVRTKGSKLIQYGVVWWSAKDCGNAGRPDFYGNVGYYRKSIRRLIKGKDEGRLWMRILPR